MVRHHKTGLRAKVLHAVREEEVDKLKMLLDNRHNPLSPHHQVLIEALHESCLHNKIDHARYLLSLDVSADAREASHRRTPIMRAGSVDIAELLKGADVNARDKDGKTAIMLSRNYDVSKYLLEQTALDVKLYDNEGHTALTNVLLDYRKDLRLVCKDIAIMLINNANVDVNAADPQGRTVLMTAVWRNESDVVRHLLKDQRLSINKCDVRGRNVLHHLCEDVARAVRYRDNNNDQNDDEIVALLLGQDIELNKSEDIGGRTPLHCALIAGNQGLATAILESKKPVDLKLQDHRKWSALHFASAHGMHELVAKLLKANVPVCDENADGLTPFQLAATCRDDVVETMKLLRAYGGTRKKTPHSKTLLHLAAEIGNLSSVEYLLQYFLDEEVNLKDDFGDTALLCAARNGHDPVVQLLLPLSTSSALPDNDEKKAAAGSTATVVDFIGSEIKVTSRRVHDLVYDRSFSSPTISLEAELQRTVGKDEGPMDDNEHTARFRWVHLPANDVTFCKRLFLKLLLEKDSSVHFETYKALEQSFDHQQKGKHLHACYMRPTCHHNPQMVRSGTNTDGASAEHAIDDDYEDASDFGSHSVVEQSTHYSSRRHSRVRAKSLNAAHDDPPDRDLLRQQLASLQNQSLVPDNVYLFMPYLHFETIGNRDQMLRAVCKAHDNDPDRSIPRSHRHHPRTNTNVSVLSAGSLMGIKKRTSSGKKHGEPFQIQDPTPDEHLIYAHAMPSSATLQIRRTLDQYFYRTIDTSLRDVDQVIYREQQRQAWDDVELHTTTGLSDSAAKEKAREIHHKANIIMVDQLWLWIVRDDLIVTSFPCGWNKKHYNDNDGVWQAIRHDLQRPNREPVLGVHELATIITGHCYGWVDRRDSRDSNLLFLNMFESSLGYAMEEEVRLFRVFQRASEKASVWLKEIRGHPVEPVQQSMYERYATSVFDLDDEEDDEDQHNKSSDNEPAFVQTLLDIGAETRLLREVKDIRDELDMLKMIYKTQDTHVPEMFSHLVGLLPEGDQQRKRIEELHQDQIRHIKYPLRDIERMSTQAERIYNSIRDLLDLKQKHANAMQATDTARQGKTLMVFTIVTVIFLPLSFLAAFFAIPLIQFPHKGKDGGIQMSLSYVSSYVFGIGSAIALLCVVFAWSAEKLDILRIHMQRSVRLWWRGLRARKAIPPPPPPPPPVSAPARPAGAPVPAPSTPAVAPVPPSPPASNGHDLESQKNASSPPMNSRSTRLRGFRLRNKT